MRQTLVNALVVTMDKKNRIGKFDIFISDERISRVVKAGTEKPLGHIIDFENRIILPGFINAHIHGDMLAARGLGDELTLHEQGEKGSLTGDTNWFYEQITSRNRKSIRALQYIEAIRSGTTFVCDFIFRTDNGEDICAPLNQVGLDGALVVDYRKDFSSGEYRSRDELAELVGSVRNQGYVPMLQGPSEEGFNRQLLNELKEFASLEHLSIMLHLAETTKRCDMIFTRYGKSPVSYLNSIGFLDPHVIGSHGVYLDNEDRDILKQSGASIISSPTAEMKIADGAAPIVPFLEIGGKVGLGTDGALWNDSADMFSEMKNLMLLQRLLYGADKFSAWDALRAATTGGAAAIGLEQELGSIEVGKLANLAVIDPTGVHMTPTCYDEATGFGNVLQNIVSCARPSDVETVFVRGKEVLKNRKITQVDEQQLISEIQLLGPHMVSKNTKKEF